jgi:hypothetical protein
MLRSDMVASKIKNDEKNDWYATSLILTRILFREHKYLVVYTVDP